MSINKFSLSYMSQRYLQTVSKKALAAIDYFSSEKELIYPSLKEISFFHRRHRLALPGFSKKQSLLRRPRIALQFQVGDIIEIMITKDLEGHSFTGICLGLRKRSFSCMDTTVILRNVIFKVGVEVLFSLFENRAYRIRFHDHLRKSFFYKKSKLFYLRQRHGNRATKSQG